MTTTDPSPTIDELSGMTVRKQRILEAITHGDHDGHLDDVIAAAQRRQASQEPWGLLGEIASWGHRLITASSAEDKSRAAVEAVGFLRKSKAKEHPSEVVLAAAEHLEATITFVLKLPAGSTIVKGAVDQ